MVKGDIILIPFPFSDLSGSKLRPVVVLLESLNDITVCFITSQFKWQEPTDIPIQPDDKNGIKVSSLIRLNKIATLDKKLAIGKIGALNKDQTEDLNNKLKILFQL